MSLSAVVRQQVAVGAHSAVSMLAPVYCPEFVMLGCTFTVNGETFTADAPLSRSDLDAAEMTHLSVREHHTEVVHDDLALTRTLLDRHRKLILACSQEVGAALVDAMWRAEVRADPAALMALLAPYAPRGLHGGTRADLLAGLLGAQRVPWWMRVFLLLKGH